MSSESSLSPTKGIRLASLSRVCRRQPCVLDEQKRSLPHNFVSSRQIRTGGTPLRTTTEACRRSANSILNLQDRSERRWKSPLPSVALKLRGSIGNRPLEYLDSCRQPVITMTKSQWATVTQGAADSSPLGSGRQTRSPIKRPTPTIRLKRYSKSLIHRAATKVVPDFKKSATLANDPIALLFAADYNLEGKIDEFLKTNEVKQGDITEFMRDLFKPKNKEPVTLSNIGQSKFMQRRQKASKTTVS